MNINPLALPTILLSAVAFWIGKRAESKFVESTRSLAFVIASICAIPALLYILYYTHLFDNAAWFYNFRAIRYTELLASGIGLIAGWLYSASAPESFGEKLAIPSALLILVAIPFIKPVMTPLDYSALQDRCDGDACLQTTFSTCGPTSAANVLKILGTPSSERELAEAAYTYRGGTENWYLSRALRQRGFDTNVMVAQPLPDRLPTPSIAGVILGGGAGHFVAVLSQDRSNVTMVDPLKGKLVVPRVELTRAYHFTGFFLVVHRRAQN